MVPENVLVEQYRRTIDGLISNAPAETKLVLRTFVNALFQVYETRYLNGPIAPHHEQATDFFGYVHQTAQAGRLPAPEVVIPKVKALVQVVDTRSAQSIDQVAEKELIGKYRTSILGIVSNYVTGPVAKFTVPAFINATFDAYNETFCSGPVEEYLLPDGMLTDIHGLAKSGRLPDPEELLAKVKDIITTVSPPQTLELVERNGETQQ